MLEDVEGHGETKGSFRERKIPKIYLGYATYMMKLIEEEPPTYEESNH